MPDKIINEPALFRFRAKAREPKILRDKITELLDRDLLDLVLDAREEVKGTSDDDEVGGDAA